jgi:hypothetical protein
MAIGDVMVRRQFEHDQLTRVWVGRVAATDDRGVLMWIADRSPARDVIAADGRPFAEVPFADWGRIPKRLDEQHWTGNTLMLHPPGAGFSVWWFFGAGHSFRGWYVNLERPGALWSRDTLRGIDTVDHDIDIVVAPDRSWQWKDEEQFVSQLKYPHYWVEDEAAVRAAGAAAVALIEAGAFPFDGSWCDFTPDTAWSQIVELPVGWDGARAF